jgi:hypothetical protein
MLETSPVWVEEGHVTIPSKGLPDHLVNGSNFSGSVPYLQNPLWDTDEVDKVVAVQASFQSK